MRLVVTDDLQRSRLTVLLRLLLVIPQLIWLYLWFWIFISVVVFNWITTLVSGRTEPDVHSFLGRWLRFATHVLAYLHLVANPCRGSRASRASIQSTSSSIRRSHSRGS